MGAKALITLLAVGLCAVLLGGPAVADPTGDYGPTPRYDQPQPLPVVTPGPTDWQPMFPFPFDQLRRYVTDADVTAEREMCQWFNTQYDAL